MRFSDWFEAELLKSEHPLTLLKYREHFRDYYKEVIQEKLLHYHGGIYRDPEFHLCGFKEEAKSCVGHAIEYIMKGLY